MAFNPFAMFTGEPLEAAADAKRVAAEKGYADLAGLYGQSRDALSTNYTKALDPYLDLQTRAGTGYDAYADASGANGPAGLARARVNFNASVQPDVDTAVEKMLRAGNAGGLAIGNTMQGIGDSVAKTMQSAYGDYVSRLNPFLSQLGSAAGGIANIFTGLGGNLANIFTGQGQAANKAQQDIGQANADKEMADYVGSQNLWNFGLNAAKVAASFANPMGAAAGSLMGGLTGSAPGTGMAPPSPANTPMLYSGGPANYGTSYGYPYQGPYGPNG